MDKVGLSGKYQTYPEYKDSGVEWIGEIPTDWDMWKITHACPYVASGTTPKSDGSNYYDGTNLWVTTGELREGVILDTTKKVTDKALYDLPTLRIHPKGSVVIAMYGATIGRLGILGNNATTNQACCVMPPSDIINNKYLFYWLYSTRQEIINLSSGGGQPNVNQEKISSLKVSAPTYKYQVEIANFLDHETAKIDTLIEKQQQLIKLLKEKRQAVISHAVTKGLNPNAPMRDSGVEWLGEVPEHWKVLTVRNLIRAQILEIQDGNHGEQHPIAAEYVDEGIPFLMANNVQKGKVSTGDCKFISLERAGRLRIGFAQANDVLLTHKGTVGEVGLIPEEINEPYWMLTPQVTYYRWKNQDYFNKYFYMLFQSGLIQEQLKLIGGKQSTRAYVGLVAQGDLLLVVPSKTEQVEIYSELERSVDKYEYLISRSETTVSLLKERRTALISAAVTGKIDVRDWVAPESSNNTMDSRLRGNDAELNAAVDLNLSLIHI